MRECSKGLESKSLEKAKIRPLATLKPFDQPWQNLTWVTTSWTPLGMSNFVALPLGVFVPYIRDVSYNGMFLTLFWVLATRYSLHPETYFYEKYAKRRRFGQGCAFFGSVWPQLICITLNFRKTVICGTDFDWTLFFAAENRYNMEML